MSNDIANIFMNGSWCVRSVWDTQAHVNKGALKFTIFVLFLVLKRLF